MGEITLSNKEFKKYEKEYYEDDEHMTCPTCNHKQRIWNADDDDWIGGRYCLSYHCDTCNTNFILFYKLSSVEVDDERTDTGGEFE